MCDYLKFKYSNVLLSLVGYLYLLSACGDPVAPVSSSAACYQDQDCFSGQICLDNECIDDLISGGQMMGGEEQGGESIAGEEIEGGPCLEDWDCQNDEYCDLAERTCLPKECYGDEDCQLGAICLLSLCVTDVNADRDRDGVPDLVDNCPNRVNTDQDNSDRLEEERLWSQLEAETQNSENASATMTREEIIKGDACDNDDDNDGILDVDDNCPLVKNAPRNPGDEQADLDGDRVGDVCDSDQDDDGIRNEEDNCPQYPNPDQLDRNYNGIGDVCDFDDDHDSIPNYLDNCPLADGFNPDQSNIDGDYAGDLCDDDIDGDGVLNDEDNCPYVYNPPLLSGVQRDTDQDGIGDACSQDFDGDGVLNDDDSCPNHYNPVDASGEQPDYDLDQIGDPCDPDRDGDQIRNEFDYCPLLNTSESQDNQADQDGDEIGDLCDLDKDGDGIVNVEDNCPNLSNLDQNDQDLDDIGDRCDSDLDGDLIENTQDNCPNLMNETQDDLDSDGVGDACDEDRDGDGVNQYDEQGERLDNCPNIANVNQDADMDDDGIGDVCDSDRDGDGYRNTEDNCPNTYNPSQATSPGQLVGNACAVDQDQDGVFDEYDNCPYTVNPNQYDQDQDGLGDVCDDDSDGDSIPNTEDNCPFEGNNDQEQSANCILDSDNDGVPNDQDLCPEQFDPEAGDLDEDGIGDACDLDIDNDGLENIDDNCVLIVNSNQADRDQDGIGDACDDDLDGDGITNNNDNCVSLANADQRDSDLNGVGDVCEEDSDLDTILDVEDNCPDTVINDQSDFDGDGIGNVCDDDIDGDGLGNTTLKNGETSDNCIGVFNPDQLDSDSNGVGDACEGDIDSDGINDAQDNCPDFPNPNQFDSDQDGRGDHCDNDLDGDGYDEFDALGQPTDNCPLIPNADQNDMDNDEIGDACDFDRDGDGVDNYIDNCPNLSNPNQEPGLFGLGLACLDDGDGDGVTEADDNCPDINNPTQSDQDFDGIGDLCDEDRDGDGVNNDEDNCPTIANLQFDRDQDGLGDQCDPNIDNDLYLNFADNCPEIANDDQADFNGNGIGDVCEADQDGDGLNNVIDLCPNTYSLFNADLDRDGIGDVCDEDIDGDQLLNVNDPCPWDTQNNCAGDADSDGVLDNDDNCAEYFNPTQANSDGDEFGDACDLDQDNDGWDYPAAPGEVSDNCPAVPNNDQFDSDGNGVGDACEEDSDGDTWPDPLDNCPNLNNFRQDDQDGDGIGDLCDLDIDGDGVLNLADNCRFTQNADQANIDNDTLGDLCDQDRDGDGYDNQNDNCQNIPNPNQHDSDLDQIGDACDPDLDNDQVLNQSDNCPSIPNSNQRDFDQDGLGDQCDDDLDGDTITNSNDNCPTRPNTDQLDSDNDGVGDVCENIGSDSDNDGVDDAQDNCRDIVNTDQLDNDGDNIGDLCDSDDDNDRLLDTEEDINGNGALDAGETNPYDPDTDNDGVSDFDDNCPRIANDQADSDGDGIGNVCENTRSDDDGDEVINILDNCPNVFNPGQEDIDNDLIGNLCDNCREIGNSDQADNDTDGIGDACDNCPNLSNPDQFDTDSNGIGDACENNQPTVIISTDDDDGDLWINSYDNCPSVWNPAQADHDVNGIGDACQNSLHSSDEIAHLTASIMGARFPSANNGYNATDCDGVSHKAQVIRVSIPKNTSANITARLVDGTNQVSLKVRALNDQNNPVCSPNGSSYNFPIDPSDRNYFVELLTNNGNGIELDFNINSAFVEEHRLAGLGPVQVQRTSEGEINFVTVGSLSDQSASGVLLEVIYQGATRLHADLPDLLWLGTEIGENTPLCWASRASNQLSCATLTQGSLLNNHVVIRNVAPTNGTIGELNGTVAADGTVVVSISKPEQGVSDLFTYRMDSSPAITPLVTLRHNADVSPALQRLRNIDTNKVSLVSVGADENSIELFDVDLTNPPANDSFADRSLALDAAETLIDLEVRDMFFDDNTQQDELVILVENSNQSYDVKLYNDGNSTFVSLGLNLPNDILDLALGYTSEFGNPEVAILAGHGLGTADASLSAYIYTNISQEGSTQTELISTESREVYLGLADSTPTRDDFALPSPETILWSNGNELIVRQEMVNDAFNIHAPLTLDPVAQPPISSNSKSLFIDLNGDSYLDFANLTWEGSTKKVMTYLSDKVGTLVFNSSLDQTTPGLSLANATSMTLAELTGDGLVDLLYTTQDLDGQVNVFLAAGTLQRAADDSPMLGFSPAQQIGYTSSNSGNAHLETADINCDGIKDILWLNTLSDNTATEVYSEFGGPALLNANANHSFTNISPVDQSQQAMVIKSYSIRDRINEDACVSVYTNAGNLVYEETANPAFTWDMSNLHCNSGILWAGDMNGDQQDDFICFGFNGNSDPELVLSGPTITRINLAELSQNHAFDISSSRLQVQRPKWKSNLGHNNEFEGGNQLLLSAGSVTVYLELVSAEDLAIESTQSRSNANTYTIDMMATAIRDVNHDGAPDLLYVEALTHNQGGLDSSSFKVLYNGSASYMELFGRRAYQGNRVNNTPFMSTRQGNPLFLNQQPPSVVPYFEIDLSNAIIPETVTALELQVNEYRLPLPIQGSLNWNLLQYPFMAYLTGLDVSNSTWTVKAYENGVECALNSVCDIGGTIKYYFGNSPLTVNIINSGIPSCIDTPQAACLLGINTSFTIGALTADELSDGEAEFFILVPESSTTDVLVNGDGSFPNQVDLALLAPEIDQHIGHKLTSVPDTVAMKISYTNSLQYPQIIRARVRALDLASANLSIQVSAGAN